MTHTRGEDDVASRFRFVWSLKVSSDGNHKLAIVSVEALQPSFDVAKLSKVLDDLVAKCNVGNGDVRLPPASEYCAS